MSTTTNKKNAVKGTVAAAAGIAVLLGGVGTFALWNANGAIGTTNTGTGELTATISKDTAWQDVTPNATNDIQNISAFKMVPGDTLVGTTDVKVTATGENLKVNATLDYAETDLPDGVSATMQLTNDADQTEVTTLSGANSGTEYDLTATVTLAFDSEAKGSMTKDIDLSAIKIDLQQVSPSA